MRKETINTFSDGMSLDLNPLGTPAKTLTNCLNGTLITYNGNELTLQNDMGNVPVGTAALPKGYIPIGTKEYGGIIYVASYNPETKKGQLGCFPSPQQIYTSEAAQTIVDINLQSIFIDDIINNIPFIKLNEYREDIFKDSITQQPKVFNSGDLFIIKSEDKFSELLREAIDKNIIVLKLLIYPTEGGNPIDITSCDDFKLTLYEDLTSHKDLWIFQNVENMYSDVQNNISFDELINNYRQYLQAYPKNIGPGILQLVIEFNTFKLFNLYNKINKEQNGFNIQFVGIAASDTSNVCQAVDESSLIPMTMVGSINDYANVSKDQFNELPEIIYDYSTLKAISKKYLLKQNTKLFYDILPASKWGAVDHTFLKSGTISYNEILNYQDKIQNWSFEINKTEAIIKWRFLHVSEDIDHIRFVFIPLDHVSNSDNVVIPKQALDQMFITGMSTLNSQYVYKLNKPYFSGDFEDSFPIDSEHLSSNYIYLCRLDIIYKNGEVKNGTDYKLLYTGTFFNTNDIQQFNYDSRPEVDISLKVTLLSNQTIVDKNYTIIKEEGSGITSQVRTEISPNDFMFLANKEHINKLIGATVNIEYEITSNINIDPNYSATFNNKTYTRDSFAGNIVEENVLHTFGDQNKIEFLTSSNTNYLYDQDGDELIEQCKKDYIEQEEINGVDVNLNPKLTFTYNSSGKYTNTSRVKVHRGIISRLGQPEDKNVIHQGLYPVYEPENVAYNHQLFGFKVDDQDFISNCLLFKHNGIDNYMADIGGWAKDPVIYPFSENAIVQGNNKIIDQSTEYDKETFEQSIANMGNRPINICVTNESQPLYDDFDIYGRNEFQFQLTMPHEISFNETSKTGRVLSEHYMTEQAETFKEDYLGYSSWKDGQAFFRPQTTTNCITISWRTQYGHRLINIATPLDIENDSTEDNVITIERKNSNKFKIYTDSKKHTFSNMHLRAEKLLFCMLSQILIAKCKNDTLRLNAPDILYKTDIFNNELLLSLNKTKNISLSLNGKDIELSINGLLRNNILDKEDIFIPKFKTNINEINLIIRNTLSDSNITTTMTGIEYPYFSSITEEQIKNIYPGKIISMQNQYICELEKNEDGTYKVNEELVDNGKFYKIFLPTLISESNVPGKKFSCTNTNTYKFILEGCAYNDVLLPLTKILDIQGKPIKQLKSQDSDNPQFNLLYYNATIKQKEATGAVTLFGDQSAFVDASNFTNPSSFKMETDLWKNIDLSMYQEIENKES